MYRILLRPLLFGLSPERAHHVTMWLLQTVLRIPGVRVMLHRYFVVRHPALERRVCGITFPNPVGLAAGFDKNGEYLHTLEVLGFGFVEAGTVTPLPQPGNPKPRLFRLAADRALINRMGFNNRGAEVLAAHMRRKPAGMLVGANIGKNKDTPNEHAAEDYLRCYDCLHSVADYFVVNVSSPNTPNLRDLQGRQPLTSLLEVLKSRNQEQVNPRPIWLKIAPDLSEEQLDEIVEIVQQTGIDGIVATNTTVRREYLRTPSALVERIGAGGLSGAPLTARSLEVVRYLRQRAGEQLPIVAVGGVMHERDALALLHAGASLVQVYTGLVYEGPALVRRINRALLKEYLGAGASLLQ